MYGAAFSSSNEEVVAVVGSAAIAAGAISLRLAVVDVALEGDIIAMAVKNAIERYEG